MPEDKVNQTILDRVVKLQTQTVDRGATPDEADTAQRLAGKVMARYGISQSQVDERRKQLERPDPLASILRWAANFRPVPTRADVARRHKVDPKKFRKWLRDRPEIAKKWNTIAQDKQAAEDLVNEYRSWGGT